MPPFAAWDMALSPGSFSILVESGGLAYPEDYGAFIEEYGSGLVYICGLSCRSTVPSFKNLPTPK